ncbi:MAG: AsmA family protein [Alphaproteobacteria bacterium]
MKKIVLSSLGGLIVLLVAAVLIVPGFIDWNAHKGRIVSVIQEKTGRSAAIEGDIDLAILPAPALRVAGVRLANFEGAATPDMLRLKEVHLRLSIGALLGGRIVIEQLDLVEPVIALEVAADGRASWDFQPSGATPGPDSGVAGTTGDGESAVDISLASVTIRNGSVTYHNAGAAQTDAITGLDMAISAPSLYGPFTVSGDAQYRGLPVTVDLKTGPVIEGRPISVALNLELPEAGASVSFNGAASDTGPDAQITGEFVMTGDNADRLAAMATGAGVSPILNRPVSVEAALSASRNSVTLNDARIRFGETLGNGAVSIVLGDVIGVDVAISMNRIDLDKMLADYAAGPGKASTPAAQSDGAASPAAPGTPAAPTGFTLPQNVDASLDLGIEAIQYNGGVIRQAGIRGGLANGAVTLDHASALLPGGSDISLVGFLQPVKGQPKFDGDVAIASDSLRSLLQWIGVDTAALPADRLRGFSYTGKISATPDAVQAPDFNVRLDASTMHGGLVVALRDRLGFGLRLDIDQLNLDAYFPESTAAAPKAGDGAATAARPAPSGAATAAAAPLAFLEKFDANVDLRLDRITYRKSIARKFAFDGQLVGGALTIRKFGIADIAGASLGATGTVQGFASTPGFAVDFDIAVADPERLFLFLDMPPPIPLAQLGKPTARGRVAGNLSAVTLDTNLTGAGAAVHLQGPLDMAAAAPGFDFRVALSHPELSDFVRLFMPDFHPAAEKLGALKGGFAVKGTPAALDLSSLDMAAGPVAVKGKLSLALDGPRPNITADLATSEVLMDLFQPVRQPTGSATARGRQQRAVGSAPGGADAGNAAADRWSREPIDLSAMQALDANIRLVMGKLISGNFQFDKPQLDVALTAGRLDLKQVTAGFFGGTVSGKGSIDSATGGPKVDITLTAAGIDTARAATAFGGEPRVSGPVSVNATVTAAGTSEAALVSALSGQGDIAGKLRVLATGNEQQAIGAVGIAAALFGDKVREIQQIGGLATVLVRAFGDAPADLSGNFEIQQGVLRTQDTVLTGAGARAITVATADLPRWTIDSTTSVLRGGDAAAEPYISIGLSGPLDSPNVRAGGTFLSRDNAGAAEPSDPIGKILQGVTGGDGQSQEKVKPEDVLKGLLKGLGR